MHYPSELSRSGGFRIQSMTSHYLVHLVSLMHPAARRNVIDVPCCVIQRYREDGTYSCDDRGRTVFDIDNALCKLQ